MSAIVSSLEIPQTLLDPDKEFSKRIAEGEMAVHAEVFGEAHILLAALQAKKGKKLWVPLDDGGQRVTINQNGTWDGDDDFTHLKAKIDGKQGKLQGDPAERLAVIYVTDKIVSGQLKVFAE